MKQAVLGTVPELFPSITAAPDIRRWQIVAQRWAGLALSAAILIAVAVQLGRGGLSALGEAAPSHPAFWGVFALSYLAPSVAEWVIFRRLWGLPALGLVVLLRKRIANELVLGYSGDAHFYLWARGHLRMANSPFGAVKDVAILSAVAGNAVTLILMALSWPLLAVAVEGPLAHTFAWSAAIIAATSLILFGLRRQLFSLVRRELLFVFAVHVGRIVASLALLALLAHLILPEVALQWLLVLVTLRMMLSRLPLLPAKDVVFAGLVAVLFGREALIVPAIALIGSLTIATHLLVGLLTALASFAPRKGAA